MMCVCVDDGFVCDDDEDDGVYDDVVVNIIVVYIKFGCCLCDGLKDKFDVVVDVVVCALFGVLFECL